MRVLFITRGYPGLGRVMGALALNDLLSDLYKPDNYEAIFTSYLSGYTFLTELGYKCEDMYPDTYYYRPNAFCNPFGIESQVVQTIIIDFEPDLVVIDGEPLLINLITDIFKIPVLILTHPSDLHNPDVKDRAIDLFRYYYSHAELVIAHGITRLPLGQKPLGGKAGDVIECNTLVRTAIADEGKRRRSEIDHSKGSTKIVGVMGGGSENVYKNFRSSTRTLAEWLIRASVEEKVDSLEIYCADQLLFEYLGKWQKKISFLKLMNKQAENTSSLIDADIIVGRSGRNLVSEMLTLGARSLMVTVTAEQYRSADQYRTGEAATNLTPSGKWIIINDGFSKFQSSFHELIKLPPASPTWVPGNEWLKKNLTKLIQLPVSRKGETYE